jgi:hypothetical protein
LTSAWPSISWIVPEATAATGPEYVWWPDVVSPVVLPEVRAAATGKQVTDRYLLGLARKNAGQVATFDQASAKFGGRTDARAFGVVKTRAW